MLVHPNFDPVALELGPVAVHWYGLMYALGFIGVFLVGYYRVKRHAWLRQQGWNAEQISDLIFYGALGVIIGGRLGYVLFYKPMEYLQNPLEIFMVNQGGMSFHGGLLGVILGVYWFARKTGKSFLQVGDFIAPLAPIGLFFGRFGNFINQELWGNVTDVPWGMVFASAGPEPRHPSMLYEAFLEGILLFVILMWFTRRPRREGMAAGLFLIGYAVSRIAVEFVRVPDDHLNYLYFGWVTMGQVLSLPMLLFGLYLIVRPRS